MEKTLKYWEVQRLTAMNIVERAFDKKVDKGGNPYIHHLSRVAEDAKNYYNGNDNHFEIITEIIGILHDLVEDCQPKWTIKHIEAIFPDSRIYKAVDLLTKKPDVDYKTYIYNIKMNPYARAVKMADLKHNMDLTRLKEINERDIERVKKYHESFMYLFNYKPENKCNIDYS